MHDKEFVRAVSSTKAVFHLPFFGYADQVVSPAKVHLCKGARCARLAKQVGNAGERSSVILGDTVEITVVYG